LKTYIESKPGIGSSEQHLPVLPFGKVSPEIGPSRSGDLDVLDSSVGIVLGSADCEHVFDILRSLKNVALDIHTEAGGLRDGETEVESNNTRDSAKTDEEAPHIVNVVHAGDSIMSEHRALVGRDDNRADNGSS
jgi:hypothetical protein